ncbi:hypothetical protein Srufu_079810 (plasmid) [Streptomyces libani subsp. rufus]|nr:hypothetical protein Srufu_079810 [Streptomyces libani subsp. rufus]
MNTAAQPLSTDDLIADLATNLQQLTDLDERITPFTVIEYTRHAGLPNVGYTDAYNALHALHSSGLIHETDRPAIYATRPDLPTSGNGHVWLRINNRACAPVEVIATRPRPTDNSDTGEEFVRWTCHGCGHGQVTGWFAHATKHAQEHADRCYGQSLTG